VNNSHFQYDWSAVMSIRDNDLPAVELAGGMKFSAWCKRIGICRRTGSRWRDEGKVHTIWRHGIEWVTAAEIRAFFQDDGSRTARGAAAISARQRQEREQRSVAA
jgi:predicted site-specific integrase-resolvase